MIGRIHAMVVDCPDPVALTDFYIELTGLTTRDGDNGWITLAAPTGSPGCASRRSTGRSPCMTSTKSVCPSDLIPTGAIP